jgi:hypothetical protein
MPGRRNGSLPRDWFAPLTLGAASRSRDLRGRLEALLAGARHRPAAPLSRRQALVIAFGVAATLVPLSLLDIGATPYDRNWSAGTSFQTVREVTETGEYFTVSGSGGRATRDGRDTVVEFRDNLLCWTPEMTARTSWFRRVPAVVEVVSAVPGGERHVRYRFPGVPAESLRSFHVRYDRGSGPFVLPRRPVPEPIADSQFNQSLWVVTPSPGHVMYFRVPAFPGVPSSPAGPLSDQAQLRYVIRWYNSVRAQGYKALVDARARAQERPMTAVPPVAPVAPVAPVDPAGHGLAH